MNVKSVATTNAVDLASLMVILSVVMLIPFRHDAPDFRVFDLKPRYRARRYVDETTKHASVPPDEDLVSCI